MPRVSGNSADIKAFADDWRPSGHPLCQFRVRTGTEGSRKMDNVTLNGRIIQAADGGLLVRFVRRTLDAKCSATADSGFRSHSCASSMWPASWSSMRLGCVNGWARRWNPILPPAAPDVAKISPPTPVLERSPIWSELVKGDHPDAGGEVHRRAGDGRLESAGRSARPMKTRKNKRTLPAKMKTPRER
jgi:hypothetical protein